MFLFGFNRDVGKETSLRNITFDSTGMPATFHVDGAVKIAHSIFKGINFNFTNNDRHVVARFNDVRFQSGNSSNENNQSLFTNLSATNVIIKNSEFDDMMTPKNKNVHILNSIALNRHDSVISINALT